LIHVYLLAGIRLYREGLAFVLDRTPSIRVVGGAGDWEAGAAEVTARPPDVVLLDMTMPDSLEAVAEILALSPTPRVVATALPEDEDEVLTCAEAGISGYVTCTDSIAAAVNAIESVARGELLTTPRVAAVLLQRVRSLAAAAAAPAAPAPNGTLGLTPREREIATLLTDGHTNKAIALRLGIEPTTVKNHVHNILEKLQVNRRTEAAVRLRGGLHSVPLRERGTGSH
jgi:DNA-binding NarL/FixJ family response regulator